MSTRINQLQLATQVSKAHLLLHVKQELQQEIMRQYALCLKGEDGPCSGFEIETLTQRRRAVDQDIQFLEDLLNFFHQLITELNLGGYDGQVPASE